MKPGRPSTITVLLWAALASLVLTTIFLGASWGFPVQDDVYLIHLLRAGGPALIAQSHPDRPVVGLLLAASARLAGEGQTIYVLTALFGWTLLAGEAAWLWLLLFPQWSGATCVVALAMLAPIVNRIQFTTMMTTIPCTIPVVLVLAALILLLRRPQAGRGARIAALVLVADAALISEYAFATALAASALLWVLGRRRSLVWLAGGLLVGYAAFRAISDVTLRTVTDPGAQLDLLRKGAWSLPLRLLSAFWATVAGAWGRAASEVQWDWSSKSTILAAGAALAAGATAAALVRASGAESTATRRPILALGAAVAAGLLPVVLIEGWPRSLLYDTRFQLPILAFASCLTIAIVLTLTRREWRAVALGLMAFVAVDLLIVRAVEVRRRQPAYERFGRALLPIVQRGEGLVVLVVSDPTELAAETMFKVTDGWTPRDAERFWVEDAAHAAEGIGPRSGCRDPKSVRLTEKLRWKRAPEEVSAILWEPSGIGTGPVEPYFLGCAGP